MAWSIRPVELGSRDAEGGRVPNTPASIGAGRALALTPIVLPVWIRHRLAHYTVGGLTETRAASDNRANAGRFPEWCPPHVGLRGKRREATRMGSGHGSDTRPVP
jgi:hypothetical protein